MQLPAADLPALIQPIQAVPASKAEKAATGHQDQQEVQPVQTIAADQASRPVAIQALQASGDDQARRPIRSAQPTRAWGLSAGGGGGTGFTYRITGPDGAGWTFAGSLFRVGERTDTGLPFFLAGIKRHWTIQESGRSRLYQCVGTSVVYNPYPSFNRPFPGAVGGGSLGAHTLGTGYGIQIALPGHWKAGFELDLGFAVAWPGDTPGRLMSWILPMPELSLLFEY